MNDRADTPTEEPEGKRSRRAMLAGAAAGGLGLLAAETLARAPSAGANTGDNMVVGIQNIAQSGTTLSLETQLSQFSAFTANTYAPSARGIYGQTLNGPFGIVGQAGGADPLGELGGGWSVGVAGKSGIGVYGETEATTDTDGSGVWGVAPTGSAAAGVRGESDSGPGVSARSSSNAAAYAQSSTGEGVYAQSGATEGTNPGGAKNGVHGVTDSATDSGVWGENVGGGCGVAGLSSGGDGVYGQSGSTVGQTSDQSGVHGVTDAAGYSGVYGEFLGTGVGAAVHGNNLTGKGQGVIGYGPTGVFGLATPGGTGVVASTALDGTGLALDALGPTQFSLSGLASIPAGSKSGTVSSVSLRSGSLVLATVQNNCGVYVKYVVPNVAGSSISINLSKAVPKGKTAQVAWFVVN